MKRESSTIQLRGVSQNNLKGLDLDIPIGKMTVITGVSGSGKSSLAFDTLYAEGQRRYVETFSPYTRQFLERLDSPQVESIEGILPSIAIGQRNTVKTSRSTVGTLTELCDFFKIIMAHRAEVHCPECRKPVVRDHPDSVSKKLKQGQVLVCFPVKITEKMSRDEMARLFIQQGYRRLWMKEATLEVEEWSRGSEKNSSDRVWVIQDRLTVGEGGNKARIREALEQAFRMGKGHLGIVTLSDLVLTPYSTGRHCATCERTFPEPTPSLFSFNHPRGACPKCRGFGRTIEVDMNGVIPNPGLSLKQGVIRPWQSGISAESQVDMLKYCQRRNIDTRIPFQELPARHQKWILEGDPQDPGDTGYGPWYGVRGYFRWLESKSYKMHVRVLLSRYRAYVECPDCHGYRFQPETLNYRLYGMHLGEWYRLSVSNLQDRLKQLPPLRLQDARSDSDQMILKEIQLRLQLLLDVGLGYLTLDRAARTLSGGEVQRVNLTTCLGSAVVNTLFVLDEPSVGLHPRDIEQLTRVLHALRDRGNTLVVVEHDVSMIRSADYVIDLGPFAGENGGKIVFAGPPKGLSLRSSVHRKSKSLTQAYFSGSREISLPSQRRRIDSKISRIRLEGASENNLKDVTVEIPLGRWTTVTGVSGSGKSTLIHQVLYKNLMRSLGKPVESPGRCRRISGYEGFKEILLVDQSPVGRTSRSNPVVYIGAWNSFREMFSMTLQARNLELGPGSFSFNTGEGRCGRCGGSGHEKIEMQFLSDVTIVCPLCHGRRFDQKILNVQMMGRNPSDWLGLTIDQTVSALESGNADVIHDSMKRKWTALRSACLSKIRLLQEVGLGYLRMGQPLTTLSGGEAQRLKLCGYLAESMPQNGQASLLIFDEPTTGLHLEDVRTLVGVFQKLVDAGHTLLVIEHHLDLIKCSDWILDLGPGAGEEGGSLVASGTPEQVARHSRSITGRWLQSVLKSHPRVIQTDLSQRMRPKLKIHAPKGIEIRGAREHNLKNINLTIPRDQMVVVTGLSGSGKSTLVFDLIFAEGQRRFLDCMSTYARQYVEQLPRPDLDRMEGVPPTVAIEQRKTRGGWKSTVATVTEAYHFIRLLYARMGIQHCPDCAIPVSGQREEEAIQSLIRELEQRPLRILVPLVRGRKGFHEEWLGWAAQRGITHLRVDGRFRDLNELRNQRLDRYTLHDIQADVGVHPRGYSDIARIRELLGWGGGMIMTLPVQARASTRPSIINAARICPACHRSFETLDPKDFSYHSPAGWCARCQGYGMVWRNQTLEELKGEEEVERDQLFENRSPDEGDSKTCPECHGDRLKRESLHVYVGDKTLSHIHQMTARDAVGWFRSLKAKGRDGLILEKIIPQILSRLDWMDQVGLGYLGLCRSAVTLSGGESQRIHLASQLGSNLRGVLYVLDEPTIGLHAHDHERLLKVLDGLKKKGNSLLIVEHDEETMKRADWLIDLGPGAGREGGEIVWEGNPMKELKSSRSPKNVSRTLHYLKQPMKHPLSGKRRKFVQGDELEIKGASLHNLKKVSVRFPVGRWTTVTGVSGAGKSTLVRSCLLQLCRGNAQKNLGTLRGREHIAKVVEVDQSPIGKTPRSCPVTYLGIWDGIRKLFALTPEARMRGYAASRFSFNVAGGSCPACDGQGRVRLKMNFLPDVHVLCDLCEGARFEPSTLEIRFRDLTISDVLKMSVEEAATFFEFDHRISTPLRLMSDTGLGYLTLGQSSPTLSGGEAQRLKLISELASGWGSRERHPGWKGNLYVLEEPSIGLHASDVARLISLCHQLVDQGHTLIMVEHHLDLIAEAEHVIDLGPGGGEQGGNVIVKGPPEAIARCRSSVTGRYLKSVLATQPVHRMIPQIKSHVPCAC